MQFRNTDKSSTTTKSFPELNDRQPSFVRRNITKPLNDFIGIFRNRYNYSYASGIFELPLPESYDVLGTGPVSEYNKALQFMHSTLQQYDFAITDSAKWVVFIEPYNEAHLKQSLREVDNLEQTRGDADAWEFEGEQEILLSKTAQKTIGCIFALGVDQVGEAVAVDVAGGANGSINGFLKSSISVGRSTVNTLNITTKETNTSYTDMVLRPWVILTAHKGLFARQQGENIKAKITVFQMARTQPHQPSVATKVFTYHDCAPISIGGETLSYESAKAVQRQIGFTFNYYTVKTLKDDVAPPTPPPSSAKSGMNTRPIEPAK